MRRRTLVTLGLLVSLGIGLVLWTWMADPGHRIDRQSFLRIRLGMRQQDVLDLVGCPPGDYRTGPTICVDSSVEHAVDPATAAKVETWQCDTDTVHVYYDAAGAVVGREWGELIVENLKRNPFALARGGIRHWLRHWFGDF